MNIAPCPAPSLCSSRLIVPNAETAFSRVLPQFQKSETISRTRKTWEDLEAGMITGRLGHFL